MVSPQQETEFHDTDPSAEGLGRGPGGRHDLRLGPAPLPHAALDARRLEAERGAQRALRAELRRI